MMDIVGITVWREARGEGTEGMLGVLNTIWNRADAKRNGWPEDDEKVCLQSYQFSCWNSSDPQRNLYPQTGDAQYKEICEMMQRKIEKDDLPDPTLGATAYFDDSIVRPGWAKQVNFTVKIGRLNFYKI